MAAMLGLDDDAVAAACAEAEGKGEVVEAVNFNAPEQIVIAGHARRRSSERLMRRRRVAPSVP